MCYRYHYYYLLLLLLLLNLLGAGHTVVQTPVSCRAPCCHHIRSALSSCFFLQSVFSRISVDDHSDSSPRKPLQSLPRPFSLPSTCQGGASGAMAGAVGQPGHCRVPSGTPRAALPSCQPFPGSCACCPSWAHRRAVAAAGFGLPRGVPRSSSGHCAWVLWARQGLEQASFYRMTLESGTKSHLSFWTPGASPLPAVLPFLALAAGVTALQETDHFHPGVSFRPTKLFLEKEN